MSLLCVIACCIPAGPLGWQINQISAATGVQILFEYHLSGEGPRICGHSANQLLAELSASRGLYWDWVNERTIAVLAEIPWCDPEAGSDAVSPPCRPRIST
jgi:hypothetical protein